MPERNRAEYVLPRRLSAAQTNRCRRKRCFYYAGMRAAMSPPGLCELAHGVNEEMDVEGVETDGEKDEKSLEHEICVEDGAALKFDEEKNIDDFLAAVLEISVDVDVEELFGRGREG